MASAPTSLTHWGAFSATVRDGDIASVRPDAGDADPSPLLGNLAGSIRHRSRVATPAVRRGWLDDGPGPTTRRGADEFVAVSWDELTELLAAELQRIVDTHGNEAIYGGSYGWASAGRFHHAQSQVHRFLKLLGGYTFSRHSYSLGATGVIMPRVVGTHDDLFQRSTAWDVIAENTELLVCFGGVGVKNSAVNPGGTTEHPTRAALQRLRERGGQIVSVSPLRDDTLGACEWLAPVPGTDVAMMVALAYVLATEGLVDRGFLETHCTGYPRFERYLLGLDDGVAKSPGWAAAICGLPAAVPVSLARRMAAHRTIVTVSWSLQRVRYGEQAPWMGLTLAAMLGQIGLPGGGFGHGYGSQNELGMAPLRCGLPTFPQGVNPVSTFIPVAAVSDMLLHPGEQFDYNGRTLTYPDIKCVYWAGGKPVPPSSEPAASAACAEPGGHGGGPRALLDGDGQARRRRRAVHHALRARGLLGLQERSAAGGDARTGRTVRRIPRRLHHVRGAGGPTRFRRAVHRGPRRAGVARPHVREVVGAAGLRGTDLRTSSGRRAG